MADDDVSSRLKAKQAFYMDLHEAFAESDDDEKADTGRQEATDVLRRAENSKPKSPVKQVKSSLPRSASDTNLAKDPLRRQREHQHQQPQRERPTVRGEKAPPTLTKGATFAGSSTTVVPEKAAPVVAPPSAIPRATGSKRKRDGTIALVPEPQQIFKGMHIFFFPNDDKSPARAMRMTKALEFGATWQREWNAAVTHVVVDKQYDFDTLAKWLRMSAKIEAGVLEEQGVVVVGERYLPDCIQYRVLLGPKQTMFRVKGHALPPKQAVEVSRTLVDDSPQKRSLELKPAGKSVMARQPETPRTSDEAATSQRSPLLSPGQQGEVAVERVPSTTAASTTEFDEAIRKAKDLQHVSLDDGDDDADSRPTSSGNPDTDDEGQKPGLQLLKTRKTVRREKRLEMQDRFQCMQKHTGSNENPNASTIHILQQMAEYYDQTGDEWRVRAYRKAIATLRNHPTTVRTKEEALALPQIGDRLATKIEEIAITSRLRRLDNAKAEPGDQVLQMFMKVYGAGFAKASEWVAQGYKTLDELLEGQAGLLTENQKIGIEHYVDFNSRIARAEVEQHGVVVRKALQRIDKDFEVIVGGSYRRGALTSGDIDCLITHPKANADHIRTVVLDQLVPKLFKAGFLTAALAATSRDDGSKWHGASKLPGSETWRRIDLLLVPPEEIGAALIYFTGDDIFNRSIRLLASTKGMRLNQRGLYKNVMRGKGREKLSEGSLVEGRDERKIFEVLGVPWREPHERVC